MNESTSFTPIRIKVVKNSKEWLAQRRIITASSAATKCGANEYASAQLEAQWDIEHPGEEKPDEKGYMKEGHAEEEPVAQRCAPIIFPYKQMLTVRSLESNFNGLADSDMFLHPDFPDMISTTPDKDVVGHSERHVELEIKYSRHELRTKPKVEHMMQCCVQMECVKADYMFLGYGHMQDCTSVFLIQYSPELWKWMHKRHLIYYKYALKKQIPPLAEIPFLAHAIVERWTKGTIPNWIKKDFKDSWHKPDFFPPQPKWQLVGYNINYKTCPRYFVQKYSPSGRVDASIFQRAIGSIWKRIGIDIEDEPEEKNLESLSIVDEVSVRNHIDRKLGKRKWRGGKSEDEDKEETERVLIKTLWDQRTDDDDGGFQLPVDAIIPFAEEFLRQNNISKAGINGLNSDNGEALAMKLGNFIKDKHPLLGLFLESTDANIFGAALIAIGMDEEN